MTFVLSMISISSICQNYRQVFTSSNGLPSNEVYGCLQDHRGFMWVTTADGLARYDGREFKIYTVADGLSTNFNWRLFEDSQQRLWLGNNITPFTYIFEDSVYRVGGNYPSFYLENMEEDNEGNVYLISLKEEKTYKIGADQKVEVIDSVLLMVSSENELIWQLSGETRIARLKANENCYAALHGRNEIGVTSVINAHGDTLIRFVDERFLNPHNAQFLENDLFCVNHHHGTTVFNTADNFKEKDLVISIENELEPVSVFYDNNNNLWVSDLNNGLSFFSSLPSDVAFTDFPKNDVVKRCFDWGGNYYGLGFFRGDKWLMSEDTVIKQKKGRSYQTFIAKNHDQLITSYNSAYVIVTPLSNSDDTVKVESLAEGGSVVKDEKIVMFSVGGVKAWNFFGDTIYFGTGNGAFSIIITEDEIFYEKYYDGYTYAISSFGGTVWIGTMNGLFLKKKGEEKKMLLPNSISHLEMLGDKMLVRTEDGMIFFVDPISFEVISQTDQYKSYHSLQILDGKLLLLGIDEFRLVDGVSEGEDLVVNEGLSAGKVFRIVKLQETYRLIAEKGYYDFPAMMVWKTLEQEEIMIVESISVRGGTNNFGNIALDDDDNFLNIKLAAFKFPDNKDLLFEYRFDKGKWSQSLSNEIGLFNIPFGEYTLEIRAIRKDGAIYASPIFIEISNPQPFYEANWFYFVISLVFLSMITVVILLRQRRKNHLLKLSVETAQNRQKMLVMQMKPHFLSNVFNNLQGALFSNDYETGNELIKGMDEYLRLMLRSSEESMNTLRQEIKFVRKYIELEKARVSKQIFFELSVSDEGELDVVKVPVFVLQPLVENAIWHGILPSKEETGRIVLSLKTEGNYHLVSITDNGVGLKGGNHTGNSIALKNIETRLALIDSEKRKKYVHLTEIEVGTKVTLYVAKQG